MAPNLVLSIAWNLVLVYWLWQPNGGWSLDSSQRVAEFPSVPSSTDNERTSLVIAFSYYSHRNFLIISRCRDLVLTNFHINNNTCLNEYNDNFILEYNYFDTSIDLAIATVVHYGLRSQWVFTGYEPKLVYRQGVTFDVLRHDSQRKWHRTEISSTNTHPIYIKLHRILPLNNPHRMRLSSMKSAIY